MKMVGLLVFSMMMGTNETERTIAGMKSFLQSIQNPQDNTYFKGIRDITERRRMIR